MIIYLVISHPGECPKYARGWYAIFYKRDDTWQETVAAILQHIGDAVGVTLLTTAAVDVIMLLYGKIPQETLQRRQSCRDDRVRAQVEGLERTAHVG